MKTAYLLVYAAAAPRKAQLSVSTLGHVRFPRSDFRSRDGSGCSCNGSAGDTARAASRHAHARRAPMPPGARFCL